MAIAITLQNYLASKNAAYDVVFHQPTTTSRQTALPVPVKVAVAGDKLTATTAAGQAEAGALVWLCALTKAIPVRIGRGENHGRLITYYNVVRRWTKLGDWTGASRTFSMPTADLRSDDVDAIAVIVQSGTTERPGAILGAAVASIQ